MAGEWLKFESTLPEKAETLAITAAMGWDDPDLTVGKLMRLFRWFDQQTVDGNAPNVTPALLDRIIGVTGFVTAVADVGWIVIDGKSISLHNFDRHNGATAKSRALTAKRVANHRSNAEGNDDGNAATVTPALAREEKRREEKEDTGASLPGFDRFWNAWPKSTRKEAKGKCLEAWRKAKAEPMTDLVVAHVETKKLTSDWKKEEGRFVEAPLVYLNQRRWEGAEAAERTSTDRIGSFI